LAALTNLRELRLNYNRFTGTIPSELAVLTSLSYLYLKTQLDDAPCSLCLLIRFEESDAYDMVTQHCCYFLGESVELST